MKTSTEGLFHDNTRIKLGERWAKDPSSNSTPERKDFDIQPTTMVDRCKTLTMLCITWEVNKKVIDISHLESSSPKPQDQMFL